MMPPNRSEPMWSALDRRLAGASPAGILANKLGPLAARNLRAQGQPVPPELDHAARLARSAWLVAIPLLSRIRSLVDGPLLLFKGAELAMLYPDRARGFMDLDILCPDPPAVQRRLIESGFIEVDDPEIYEQDQHHLRPLQWPTLWVAVEIHLRPVWPRELGSLPPVEEIFAGAIPSATGLAGVSAPKPAHHALMLAAHGWTYQPLHSLRDLVDVAAISALADPDELAQTAAAWGIKRLWRTTSTAADSLLGGRRRSWATRLWARHLPVVQERTVLGNHVQRWLHGFWGLPVSGALARLRLNVRLALLPYPGETWREKRVRVWNAVMRPGAAMSDHTEAWQGNVDALAEHLPHATPPRS